MSRKHNTTHNRGMSKYPQRLKSRGQTNVTVRMEDVETLRKRQERQADYWGINPYDSLGLIRSSSNE